jgi:thiol-disulfide isomerase/thioredoxin
MSFSITTKEITQVRGCMHGRIVIMRPVFCLLLFLCLIPVSTNAQTAIAVKDTTDIAPAFQFVTLNGENISSDNLKGKVIVLDFWSSDCGPCVKSMPQMEKF